MPATQIPPVDDTLARIDRELDRFSVLLARTDPLGAGMDAPVLDDPEIALIAPDAATLSKNRGLSSQERAVLGRYILAWSGGRLSPTVRRPAGLPPGTDRDRARVIAPYADSLVQAWLSMPDVKAFFDGMPDEIYRPLLMLLNTYTLSTLLGLHHRA
jgi:hypothetical protein